jgi:hypothetical protein
VSAEKNSQTPAKTGREDSTVCCVVPFSLSKERESVTADSVCAERSMTPALDVLMSFSFMLQKSKNQKILKNREQKKEKSVVSLFLLAITTMKEHRLFCL